MDSLTITYEIFFFKNPIVPLYICLLPPKFHIDIFGILWDFLYNGEYKNNFYNFKEQLNS